MQKASSSKVVDRQHVGVEKFMIGDDWCRIESVRVEIGPILRRDFCGQSCYIVV